MPPDAAETATLRTYLEWMVEIPWKKSTKDLLDLRAASGILDADHYDLEKIKERILEYLGVLKLKKELTRNKRRKNIIGQSLSGSSP